MAKTTVYVCNLPGTATDKDLETTFSSYGAANSRIVRGVGFVDVAQDRVEDLLSEMDQSLINGQKITVREAYLAGQPPLYIGDRRQGYANRNSFTMR